MLNKAHACVPLPMTWELYLPQPLLLLKVSLMFEQTTSAEQGSYMCTATNDMDTISATASLIVEGKSHVRTNH